MATEKYLELNLNDEKSLKVAEILANKTAKKILSLIADNERELTETDIANELKLALNTVDYNIKNLINAGLIEEAKNYFWSVKGKKIKTFKIANKKIIISTKSNYKNLFGFALVAGAIGFATNVFKNIFYASKQVYSDSFSNINDVASQDFAINSVEKAGEALAAPTSSGVSNIAVSASSFNFSSLFHNSWIWIIGGLLIGIILFFIYKFCSRSHFENSFKVAAKMQPLVKGGQK
jgi:DNA-binding transcriptional ArsR family regulator